MVLARIQAWWMCYYVFDCCGIMFQSGRPKWSKCVHRHLHIRFPIFSQCLAQCDNRAIYTRKNKTRLIFPRINGPNMFLVGMSIYHLHKNVLPNSWFWMYNRLLTFEILIPKISVLGAIATVYQMHEGVKSVSVKSKYFE